MKQLVAKDYWTREEEATMRFSGFEALAEGFPHTELVSDEYRFDIHNAADLVRMSLDFERRHFEVEWRVENLLASTHYGSYSTAVVILRVTGLSELSGSGQIEAGSGFPTGVEFIEYIPGCGKSGALRFVFTSAGEISLSGSACELHIAGLQ